ncbi:hypothetical protein NY406_10025 [Chlorobaculum sp. MV4-Y]|uniref:hypothetical protein n=1 Tax=Chlorobaculum sp. MV4-Y TaxID=2976335 RepID=UPI0021AE3445|nr:hypothetical protein [Chlorobaculum sp. MV4-Y]UWX57522.1 hypothetical protein NY406_10025 [Chlorobaculum sp. MV4-Y]
MGVSNYGVILWCVIVIILYVCYIFPFRKSDGHEGSRAKEIAPWTLKGAVIAGVVLISGLDWFSGHELSFFAFYFIPIAFAAWHLGFRFAVITALLIGIAWFCEDLFAGHHYFISLYEVRNTANYSVAHIGRKPEKAGALGCGKNDSNQPRRFRA